MRWVSIICLLVSNLFAFGQDLIGRVVGEDGQALMGAHVYSLTNWRDGTITDANGQFELSLTSPTDSIVVSFVGFHEQTRAIANLSAIELQEQTASSGTVVVNGKSLAAEEFKYMEIERMDMYKNPSAQADPILAVNTLPAATTVDESANISLRGSSPFETGIYLNSVPVYDAVRYSQLNGLGTFSIFSPTILKSVDVFPGNPPIELGNSTSGAIALTTDESIVEEPINSIVVSLANIGVSREQPIAENQSLKVFSNWQMSGPIKELNEEALDEVNSFNSNDLGLYYYATLGDVNVKILSYSILEGYETNFDHPSYNGTFHLNKRRNFTISTVELPVSSGTFGVQNGLSFSKASYSYSSADFHVNKSDFFFGANYQQWFGRIFAKTGFSYDSRMSKIQGDLHTFDYALAESHPLLFLDASSRVEIFDAYSYLKYVATDQLTFGAGIRKNIPTPSVPGYLSSQFNAVFSSQDWSITAGVGSYHKHGLEENSGEYFRSAAHQVAVDFRYELKNTILSLSLFSKRGEVQGDAYTATGVETYFDHRFNSRLSTTGTFTLLSVSNNESDSRSAPPYFIRHTFTYKPGRMWELTSNLLVREGTRVSSVESASFDPGLNVFVPNYSEQGLRLDPYANLSIGVNKFFAVSEKFNWILFASVNNLLDRDNVRSFSYDSNYASRQEELFSQRMVYFGAVLNF